MYRTECDVAFVEEELEMFVGRRIESKALEAT